MNVDRRWLGTSGVRVRVLAAGLVLAAAGGMLLGWGSGSRQVAATAGIHPSAIKDEAASASPLAAVQFGAAKEDAKTKAASLFASLPLMFEPNQGQANLDPNDSRARFIAHGSGYTLLLGSEGAIVGLGSTSSAPKDRASKPGKTAPLQMKLAGSNPSASLTATDLLPGNSNYLLGNDPAKWHRGIPQFARVRYRDIYPGINLVFYGNHGRLEYDFQVAPGADPAKAELEFDGAQRLELKDGALVIRGEGGDARLEAPRVYQEIAGREQAVQASFVLRGANRAGFAIGSYDPTRELVIDPVLFFSTYFGGTGDEHSSSVTVDGSGNIYLAGSTTSPQLPKGISTTVFQSAPAGLQNVYIAKINPILNPAALEYVTYLGGNGMDAPVGIGVDGAGNPMVAGTTSSTNFPTQNGYQSAPEAGSTGTQHVFVTKLNAAAQMLLYSTYLSGSVNDIASGMTTDGSGNVYVTGTTTSTNPQDVGTATGHQFPSSSIPFTPTPFQSTPLNAIQFFVTKVSTFNSGKSSIAYSTYFGGANTANSTTPVIAVGGGIAVDTNGNIYFDGTTNFTYTNGAVGDFPILNAYQPCLDQPPPTVVSNPPPPCTGNATATATDAFLAKLNPNPGVAQGQQLQWSSYFGGAETDSAAGIALDSGAANVYIVGTTNSPGITRSTSAASFQPCLDGLVDPTTKACTATSPAASDAFVARLTNPALSTTNGVNNLSLTYFSYLGGSNNEAGLAITVDSASGAVVTGWTTSSDFPVFPTPGSVQSKLTGMQDAFVARLDTVISTSQMQNQTGSWATYYGGTNTITPGVLATTQGTTIALDVNQNTYFAGDTNAVDLQVTGFPQGTNGGGYDAFVTELQTTANLSITGVLTLGTNQAYINAGNQATFTYTLTNNGPDLASNITVTDDISPSVTIVPVNFESASATSGTCGGGSTTTGVSCIISSLQAGSTATVTIVLTPKAFPNGSAATFNGGAVQVLGPNNSVLATTSVSANMSDFAISVTPPNRSVPAAGDTATYAVQLTPNPVYTTGIALSCTGLPTGAACSFSPSSVNLQGPSPGVATLSISTQARPITTGSAKFGSRRFYAVWLAVPGLGLLGVGIGSDRRRRRSLGILMLCMLFALLLLQPACSSSSTAPPTTGTPAGTYPITVTATSGTSDTKSQVIQLTVP